MKILFFMTTLILSSLPSQAELKRIIVDLEYKTIKVSSPSKKTSPRELERVNKVKVYIPDEMVGIQARQDDEVNCTTHTGSILTVSPKRQTARIDNIKGDEFSYMIVSSNVSSTNDNETLSKYVLDDGRKVVTAFVPGATTGSGYYVRHGGQISPSFPCSKN